MTTVSATMVKALRDRTGAGMMDCKQALVENSGNEDAAIDWLRKKGLAKAAKKSDRIAAEGLVGVAVEGDTGAAVEVIKAGGDLARLLAMPYPGKSLSVEEHVREMVATIGENLGVRRTAEVSVKSGVVADYIHNRAADGLGKMAVLVALESSGDKAKLTEFGRQVAMHIAAANPLAVTPEELDKAVIDKERAIYLEQAQASGKTQDIIAKMVEGRLRKEFFQQVVLMQQVFVLDGKATVEQAVKAAEKTVGAPITITKFVRYALGEGIERKDEDFAAEVAAAVGGQR